MTDAKHTPEELAMARRIMNDNAEYANGVDRGQMHFGNEAVKRMVLAAIIETTERMAWIADEEVVDPEGNIGRKTALRIAAAIRDSIKGQTK